MAKTGTRVSREWARKQRRLQAELLISRVLELLERNEYIKAALAIERYLRKIEKQAGWCK
jgi:hypothetical protein